METDKKTKEDKPKKTKITEGKSIGNNKIVGSKRPKAEPAPQRKETIADYNIVSGIKGRIGKLNIDSQAISDGDKHMTDDYDLKFTFSGTTTFADGSAGGFVTNSSANTTVTNIDKIPFITPDYGNPWPLTRIVPTEEKKHDLLYFLNSIESELIEINSKMSILPKGGDGVTLDCMPLRELFEIKKHLGETVFKNHFPGSTGNIHMITAQRRFDIIENEINNKLNVLFGDV